jgi:hypothetical protein
LRPINSLNEILHGKIKLPERLAAMRGVVTLFQPCASPKSLALPLMCRDLRA